MNNPKKPIELNINECLSLSKLTLVSSEILQCSIRQKKTKKQKKQKQKKKKTYFPPLEADEKVSHLGRQV